MCSFISTFNPHDILSIRCIFFNRTHISSTNSIDISDQKHQWDHLRPQNSTIKISCYCKGISVLAYLSVLNIIGSQNSD